MEELAADAVKLMNVREGRVGYQASQAKLSLSFCFSPPAPSTSLSDVCRSVLLALSAVLCVLKRRHVPCKPVHECLLSKC